MSVCREGWWDVLHHTRSMQAGLTDIALPKPRWSAGGKLGKSEMWFDLFGTY